MGLLHAKANLWIKEGKTPITLADSKVYIVTNLRPRESI